MRRTALVLVLVVAACSSAASEATTTTASADTSTSRAAQSLVPGGLVPADPATLIPYEDAEPIIVGESHRGVVSSNGRWAAIATEQQGSENQISIVDTETLEIVASTGGSGDGLAINDDGLAVWFEEGFLVGLGIDDPWVDMDYPGPVEPPLFGALSIGDDGRIVYLLGGETEAASATLVVVDGADFATIAIPAIIAGPVEVPDPAQPARPFVAPALVFDEGNDRVFVISALANELATIALATDETSIHPFDSPAEASAEHLSVSRDGYVDASGDVLLVATSTLELDDADTGWTATEAAADLTVIDTTDWSSTVVTQSMWTLEPSVDGSYVSGTGAAITWSQDSDPEVLQSPIYLIEGATGEILVGFEGRSGTIADTQFSGDSSEMYVVSENDEGTNIDIVDVASQTLAGSLAFTRISLIGEAGLIAFHATR